MRCVSWSRIVAIPVTVSLNSGRVERQKAPSVGGDDDAVETVHRIVQAS